MKYICSVCLKYRYDDTIGETGIEKNTNPSDFPKGWSCPVCKRPKSALRRECMKKERDLVHSLKTGEKGRAWSKGDVLKAYRKAMVAIVDSAELRRFDQEVDLVSSSIGLFITITVFIVPILELTSFTIYIQSFSLLLTILIWMAYRIAKTKASLDLRFLIVAESLSLAYFLPFTVLLLMVSLFLPTIIIDSLLSDFILWVIAFIGIVLGGGHVQRFSANYTLSRWKEMILDEDELPEDNPYTILLQEIGTDLYVDYLIDDKIGQRDRGIIQRMTKTPSAYFGGLIILVVVLLLAVASTETIPLQRVLLLLLVVAFLSTYIVIQLVMITRAQDKRLMSYLTP